MAYRLDEDEQWSAILSLPGKAMLLISLSLKPGFPLSVEKAPDWLGFQLTRRAVERSVQRASGLGTRLWS